MTTLDDWARVKLVLETALACDGVDRESYLVEACGTDAALRSRIDFLLAVEDRAQTFLETPAALLLDDSPRPEDLTGRVVSSYRLLSWLGAGGMGEVYLAHDGKLDRPVALKFLSPALADKQDRLQRFHQEARAASSLNHPHIVVVHDFGELDGRPYIVTEFVEGETLRQRLLLGPLPTHDAVEIGVQIASALAAAHARGLVHRDIKPDNIMVRPDGYVKVLDFGLAKLSTTDQPSDPSDVELRTQPGVVMGTPRYMSPEQARGLDLDARSDIWSLGVVLYEMIAGRPPFGGATPADAIAAILATDPSSLEVSAPHTPPALAAIVTKALRKDRLARYGDTGEMLLDLRRLATSAASTQLAAISGSVTEDNDESTLPSTGERRRATVLVSTVSEYASLVERLTPAEIEDVIGRIRAAAVDTMRRHGGVVNQSIGEEIVSLFGIPVAHEDDDLRAVRAALELHARTHEISSAIAEAQGLRVCVQSGLHAGSVVAQRLREGPRRYAVTGRPVETAARLAAAAEPDAILLSPDCHRLVAPFVWSEPRAPVVVHAGTSPVTPHCVLGESGLRSRLEASLHGGLTPYTGRGGELGALVAQVDVIRHGEGRLVVVSGEAGSGKSRMLHELRVQLAASEFPIFQGRCNSYDGAMSYLPFVEALHGALAGDGHDGKPGVAQLVARIRAIDPSLEPFIPLCLHLLSVQSDVFPVPGHLRGENLQAAILETLGAFFTSCAQRAPGVLLLEDWHWADDASREALRHLMALVAAYPLLIVVTTRPEPGPLRDAPDHTVRINLGPLDPAASLAIIKAVFGVEHVPEALADRLHERTGGNPFFLEEMCQGVREAGVVAARDAEVVINASAEALQLPDSVQGVIRSRLDRLNPGARELLRVASVIGREFARRTLYHAMGTADLADTIEQLKHAGIIQQIRVVPDPVYRFKHVLIQEVTYESLLEHQRQALHQVVARAIQQYPHDSLDQPSELLAYHFGRAGLWEDAIEHGLRAAGRATALSQFADALAMLERVGSWLMRLPDESVRLDRVADVLLGQERLCETLGLRGRQLQLSAELIALLAPHGGSVRLAEAYLRQGDASTLLKRYDTADRALATSLRISREREDAALERNALRSIGLLRWHQGRHADALAITESALEIDRRRQDDLAILGDLANLGKILRSMGHHQRALAILEEALAMPVIARDPIRRAYILQNIANVNRALGDVNRALEYLQDADDSARAHMLPIQRAFHLTSIAHIHLQEGRVAESLRAYQEAVDLSRHARHADGLAQSLRMMGEVLFTIGREQDALGPLQEAAQLFAQIEDREAEAVMRRHVAVVLERCSHPDAIAAWEGVRALAQAAGDARGHLDAVEGIARVTRRKAPSSEAAVRCFTDALALASSVGDRTREAALRNTLGILQWERRAYEESLAHYEAGLVLVRELGDRVHEGLTLNSIGVTLSRLRRYEEARTALAEALTINREAGERLLEAHTLAALGDIAQTLGQCDSARKCFEESLLIRREIDDRPGEGWMLHHLARTNAMMGDTAAAKTSAGAAARIAASCADVALRRACGLAEADASAADHS